MKKKKMIKMINNNCLWLKQFIAFLIPLLLCSSCQRTVQCSCSYTDAGSIEGGKSKLYFSLQNDKDGLSYLIFGPSISDTVGVVYLRNEIIYYKAFDRNKEGRNLMEEQVLLNKRDELHEVRGIRNFGILYDYEMKFIGLSEKKYRFRLKNKSPIRASHQPSYTEFAINKNGVIQYLMLDTGINGSIEKCNFECTK